MIRRVDRLVAGAVLSALGVAWLVLVGLDLVSTLARDAAEAGSGGIGNLLLQIAWTTPRRAYVLFPTAALMGSLLGLGSLAASSELVALRAAGLSKLRICLSVLAAVGALTVVVVAMGETLGPHGEQRAQSLAVSAQSPDLALARWSGLWAREGETFLNARAASASPGAGAGAPEIRLDDVRLYEFDEAGRLQRISLAAHAHHRGDHWELQKVRRVRFTDSGVESELQEHLRWVSQLDPRLLSLGVMRPSYMAAADLLRNLDYLKRNQLDSTAFEAALWARVFYPVNVLALTLCALPFAFGSLRSGGFGKGLFFGVVLGVGFWLMQRSLVNVAEVYALDMASANALPGLLLLAAAVAWLRRTA